MVSTTEALMADPTTPEGIAYWQERHDYEERLVSTVRCAGDGNIRLIQGGLAGPCGWEGEEADCVPSWEPSGRPSRPLCPDCRGRVELIPKEN